MSEREQPYWGEGWEEGTKEEGVGGQGKGGEGRGGLCQKLLKVALWESKEIWSDLTSDVQDKWSIRNC